MYSSANRLCLSFNFPSPPFTIKKSHTMCDLFKTSHKNDRTRTCDVSIP
nr:MAG TPA: hypothetical protein [Caudoviricetes sp.]